MTRQTNTSEADRLVAELHIIPASMWRCRSVNASSSMHRPAADGIFIHHSVTKATDDPCADARELDRIGCDRFGRLSYSWLFHPSGVVLAGQETHVGAHTEGRNSKSFGFCAIGDWSKPDSHTADEYAAVSRAMMGLAIVLARFGWLHAGSPVRPHSDVKATACPGRLANLAPLIGAALDNLAGVPDPSVVTR